MRFVLAAALLVPSLAAAEPVEVTLADVGLDASALDRTSDPCIDFYQYACGGWIKANPVPEDRARWTIGSAVDERTKLALRGLLDEDAKGAGADATAKKLGDFYASCMNDGAIEKLGTAPIKVQLAKVQAQRDAKTWLAAIEELHKLDRWVVFGVDAEPDYHDSKNYVTAVDAGDLGLPDRDYYFKPELKEKLDAYRAHVERMLALAIPPAKAGAAAADVVAIETDLAAVTKTAVERRDKAASYNPTDAAGLAKQVKSVDWRAYWKAMGVAPSKKIVVGSPKFLAAIDGIRAKYKPAQWANYFTYHLLDADAFALPKAFDDEAFALQKALTGIEKQPERGKRCVDASAHSLGELLGHAYVAKFFPGAARQTASTVVDAVASAMAARFGSLDWMSAPTRQLAAAKLAAMVRRVGYPDKWRAYDFAVKRDDFAGNLARARAFDVHRVLARAGKPVDRGEWSMNVFEVNAYNSLSRNTIAITAGILQAPFFGPDYGVAVNLGSIGAVVGHELSHGFDDQGAQFDADGNLKNWWQKDDLAKFTAQESCVADQYSTFEVLPKQFIQGKLTLGENIADMAGAKMAFDAYRTLREDAPKTYIADGLTEDQQFFVAYAQSWCATGRPAELQRRLTVDSHAPPKFRVYGPLRNLPEFSSAFKCAAGTPMHPAKSCTVW